jgi:hypothetical protein
MRIKEPTYTAPTGSAAAKVHAALFGAAFAVDAAHSFRIAVVQATGAAEIGPVPTSSKGAAAATLESATQAVDGLDMLSNIPSIEANLISSTEQCSRLRGCPWTAGVDLGWEVLAQVGNRRGMRAEIVSLVAWIARTGDPEGKQGSEKNGADHVVCCQETNVLLRS